MASIVCCELGPARVGKGSVGVKKILYIGTKLAQSAETGRGQGRIDIGLKRQIERRAIDRISGKLSLIVSVVGVGGVIGIAILEFALQPRDNVVKIRQRIKNPIAALNEAGTDPWGSRTVRTEVNAKRIVHVVGGNVDVGIKGSKADDWSRR